MNIESSLSAYLQTSVRYKSIHYIEKNITRHDYLALFTEVAVNILPPSAEMQLQLKQLQQTLHETVAKMPLKMREVYCLSRQEHLTHKEIAEKLGISVETVKKHIHHALQLIKIALSHHITSISLVLPWLFF